MTTLPTALTVANGLEVDVDGTLFTLEGTALRKVTPDGAATTLATLPEGTRSITLTAARYVQGLITNSGLDTAAIVRVSPEGAVAVTYTGAPLDPANSQVIAADSSGTLYVGNRGGTIYRFPTLETPTEFIRFGGGEVIDMAFDADNNLYVSQVVYSWPSVGHCSTTGDCAPRIVEAGIYKVGQDRSITTIVRNNQVARIASGPGGSLYAAYSMDHAIYRIAPDGEMTLIAGKPGEAGISD